MGKVDLLSVILGALAFFAVGAIWYGVLFPKQWQRAAGLSEAQLRQGNMALIFGLAFLFELLVALMFGHLVARTDPSPRAMMMIAAGFGASIMVPAIGISYLFQRRSGALFAIDAAHFILGTLAMGAVFVALD